MKFEQHLNGMIELRIPADRTDEILQKLPEEGIQLYQIRQKESYLYISIHLDDFRAVQQIMRENRCRFHIEKKGGHSICNQPYQASTWFLAGILYRHGYAVSSTVFFMGI